MDKQAVLQNGTIHYREVGDGYPLMLLHGALSNANTWRKVIPELSRHFRCIVPTLPLGGHAHPIHATTPITGQNMVDLIRQFADCLTLSRFALLGNDTGGAYAQMFTAAHPERVSHLILNNCDAFEIFPPKLFGTLPMSMKIPGFPALMGLAMRVPALAKSKLILGALSNTLDATTIQSQYLKSFMSDAAIRQDFKMLVLGWDNQDTLAAARQLGTFQQPVMVLWGLADKDLFPIALGERLAANFPNACLKTVEGASTYVQEDRPADFTAHIQKFLADARA